MQTGRIYTISAALSNKAFGIKREPIMFHKAGPLELIPIEKEKIKPYIGRSVCAVLNDGTLCAGILSKVDREYIILLPETFSTNSPKIQARLSALQKNANISLFGFSSLAGLGTGLGLIGGGIGLGVGILSALFGLRASRFPFFL